MSYKYENPLCKRYASETMQFIFSDDKKFSTWRRLWIALAESEKELGLDITDAQLEEMRANIENIDYDFAKKKENELRHDVMAHIHTYGECCPSAMPIIHLGATSCYVGDNTDIIVQRDALLHIKRLLVTLISKLREFANSHKELPTLAYTHFQSAQPTTVGKRAALWMQELVFDLEQLDFVLEKLRFFGCKGTTGTCASFLALFDGDDDKVMQLEKKIATKMGFTETYPVCGQTYSRKIDYFIMSVLSGIAQSAYKFSNDMRLLSHLKEFDEPFGKNQVGSSAMAYKRNPMRSERIASLSRYIISNTQNPALTAASQWFERTLDDSANKRIAVPEAFLATDAVLSLYIDIISGVTVYPKIIERHLMEELPFMATENILMYCVKAGGDRQDLHEKIRLHSLASLKEIKENGKSCDLVQRILEDKSFGLTKEVIDEIMDAKKFTGRATLQTEEFIAYIDTILDGCKDFIGADVKISV